MIVSPAFFRQFCCLALATLASVPVPAQDYPNRPVRLVVAFPPGGGADTITRLVGQRLSAELGQTVIVENKPGAGGLIGSDFVAKAPADGYTLLVGPTNQVIAPNFFKVNTDPITGFTPITQLVNALMVLAASGTRKESSFAEFGQTLRQRPDEGVIASSGVGTVFHLSGARLSQAAGLPLQHVAYRGGGPAVTDLVAGHVPIMIDTYFTFKPFAETGKVKLWATLGQQRSSLLPDVPTLEELGYRGVVAENWYGLFAPAGTPPEIVELLARKTRRVLEDPNVVARLAEQGAVPVASTPDAFLAFLKSESAQWSSVVRTHHIKAE